MWKKKKNKIVENSFFHYKIRKLYAENYVENYVENFLYKLLIHIVFHNFEQVIHIKLWKTFFKKLFDTFFIFLLPNFKFSILLFL